MSTCTMKSGHHDVYLSVGRAEKWMYKPCFCLGGFCSWPKVEGVDFRKPKLSITLTSMIWLSWEADTFSVSGSIGPKSYPCLRIAGQISQDLPQK